MPHADPTKERMHTVGSNGPHAQPPDVYASEHVMPAIHNALTKILDAMPATDHATEFVRYLREGGERQRDFIYSRMEPKTIQAMVSLEAFSDSRSELYRSQVAVCRASSDEESATNKVAINVQLLPRGKMPSSSAKDLSGGNSPVTRGLSPQSEPIELVIPRASTPQTPQQQSLDGSKLASPSKASKSVKYALPTGSAPSSPNAAASGNPMQGFNYGIPIPTSDTPSPPKTCKEPAMVPINSLPLHAGGSGSNIKRTAPVDAGELSFNSMHEETFVLPQCCTQTAGLPLYGLHCPTKTDLEDTFLYLRHVKGITKNITLLFLLQNETVFIDKVPYQGNKWHSLCYSYGINVPFRPLEEAIQSAILDEIHSAEGKRIAHHDCDTLDDLVESLELKASVTSTSMQRIYCPDMAEHPHPLLQLPFVNYLNNLIFANVLPHAPDSSVVVVDFAPSRMGLGLVQSCLSTALHCHADRFVPFKVLLTKRNGDQLLEGDSEDEFGEGSGDFTLARTSGMGASASSSDNGDLTKPIRTTNFQRIDERHVALVERRAARDEHRRAVLTRYRKEYLSPDITKEQHAKVTERIAAMQRIILNKAARRQASDEAYEAFTTKSSSVAAIAIQAMLRSRLIKRKRMAQMAIKMSKEFGIDIKELGSIRVSPKQSPKGSPLSASLSLEHGAVAETVIAAEQRRMLKALTPVRKDVAEADKQRADGSSGNNTAGASPAGLNDDKPSSAPHPSTAASHLKSNALYASMRLAVRDIISSYPNDLTWDPPFEALVRTRKVDEYGWSMVRVPKEHEDDVDSEDEGLDHCARERVTAKAERTCNITLDPRYPRRGAVAHVNICRKFATRVDPYRTAVNLMKASGCDVFPHLADISEQFAGCGGMQRKAHRLLKSIIHLMMNMAYCTLRHHAHESVQGCSVEEWLLSAHEPLLEKLLTQHLTSLCVPKDAPPAVSPSGPVHFKVNGGDWTVIEAKSLPAGAPVPWRAVSVLQQQQQQTHVRSRGTSVMVPLCSNGPAGNSPVVGSAPAPSPRQITFLTAGNLTARTEVSARPPSAEASVAVPDDESVMMGADLPNSQFITDEAKNNDSTTSGYSFFHFSIPVFAFCEPMATQAMRDIAQHLVFYTSCAWVSTTRNMVVYVNDVPFAFVNRTPQPAVILPPLAKIRVRTPPRPAAAAAGTAGNISAARHGGAPHMNPSALSPKPPALSRSLSSMRMGGSAASPRGHDAASRLSVSGTLTRKGSDMRSPSSLRRRRKNTGDEAQIVDDMDQLGFAPPQCDTTIPCDELKWLGEVSWQDAEKNAAVALKEAGDAATGKVDVFTPTGCAEDITRRGACTLEGCELASLTVQVFEPLAVAAAKAAAAEAKARMAAKKAANPTASAAAAPRADGAAVPVSDGPTSVPLYLQPVRRRSKPEVVFVGEQRVAAEQRQSEEAEPITPAAAPESPPKNESSSPLTPQAPTVAKTNTMARVNSMMGRGPPQLDTTARPNPSEQPPANIPPDILVRSYTDACKDHILRRHPLEGTFTRLPTLLGTMNMISSMSAIVDKTMASLPSSCIGIGLDTTENVPLLATALITWCVKTDMCQRILDEVSEQLSVTERIAEGQTSGGDGDSDRHSRSLRERSMVSTSSTSQAVNIRFLQKDGSITNVSSGDLSGLRLAGKAESEIKYITMTNAPVVLLPIPLIATIEELHGAAIRECMADIDDSRAFVDALLMRTNLAPVVKAPLLEMAPFVEQVRRGEVTLTEPYERFLVQKRILEVVRATERYVLLLLLHIYLTSTHGSAERQRMKAERIRKASTGSTTPRRHRNSEPPAPDTTVYTTITFGEFMRTVPFAMAIIKNLDAIVGLRPITDDDIGKVLVSDKDEMDFLGSTAGPGLVTTDQDGTLRQGVGPLLSFLPDPHYLLYSGYWNRWAANENYVHQLI